jgi:plastocyanin
MRRRLRIVPFILFLAACGGGGDDDPAAPPGSTGGNTGGNMGGGGSTSSSVNVADNSFTPAATTVARGTTVTWTWTGRNPHDVTFDDGPASATQAAGSYTRNFAAAGTFRYHCTVHGTAMAGAITVQ